MSSYYQILGLEDFASAHEVKTAFKKLALLYHPDRNPGNLEAEEKFKQINEAYQILSDPDKKSHYDWLLLNGTSQQNIYYTPDPTPVHRHPRDRHRPRRNAQAPPQPSVKPHYHISHTQAVWLSILSIAYLFFIANSTIDFYARLNYYRAVKEIEQKNYEEANRLLGIALGADPNYDKAYALKADICLNQLSHNGEAIECFSKAIELSPDPPVSFFLGRAIAHTCLRQDSLASNDFERVLQQHPHPMEVLKQIADNFFYRQKDYNRSMVMYERILKKTEGTAEIYRNRGQILHDWGQYQRALDDFSKSLSKEPHAFAYHRRAKIYLIMQQVPQSCEDWKKARSMDSTLHDPDIEFLCN